MGKWGGGGVRGSGKGGEADGAMEKGVRGQWKRQGKGEGSICLCVGVGLVYVGPYE